MAESTPGVGPPGGALAPLDELQTADLPDLEVPFWKLTGPGAVLVGLSVGAGELIIWPRIAAQYGASMIWAALLGVFLQLWLNFEIGRWTIVTGETCYTGYARVWRGFAPLFILFNILGWLAPGWANASGSALKALLVGPDGFGGATLWTCVTCAGVGLVLIGPTLIYRAVERTIELLVIIITVGLVVVVLAVGTADTWVELGRGLVNFGFRDPGMSVKDLFIAMVFAGAGGTANLFYSFYLRDKGIGMGQRQPKLQNPFRGRTETKPTTGFVYEESEENAQRFRRWWQYVKLDQIFYFFGLNLLTMMLFIFGSLAVLHPRGIVPAQGTLVWDEAAILGNLWGGAGRVIFLVVGVATLFSTQLALVDGVARSLSDIVYTHVRWAKQRDLGWWYAVIAGTWLVVGCILTWVLERSGVSDLGILFNAAYMGGFAMAVYAPLQLYINWRYLPRSARPGPLCTLMSVVASAVYIGFAVFCLLGLGR